MPRPALPLRAQPLLLPTAPEFLRLQAQRLGDRHGLISHRRRMSYGELHQTVQQLAGWLAARGIGAGDRIALIAANSHEIVAMSYALWALGAVSVPISTRSTLAELGQLLAHCRAKALLCDAERTAVARDAATAAAIPLYACNSGAPLRLGVARRAAGGGNARAARAPRPGDVAIVTYTSGTTGHPKGVVLTHANLLWSALACATARGDSSASVGAAISPLTHTPVFVSHLLCRILHGSTAVLFDRFDLATLLDATPRYGITDLSLIAGMVFEVVQQNSLPAEVRRCVRKVTVGGAATPMDAKRALAALFPESEIIEAYGQSEATNGVTMARGSSVFDHPGTVGCANPYVTVAVRRRDGKLAGVGEEGELVIAGPTVMRGYLHDRQATADTLRDGWLHTGDLGRQDASGYFYVTGRVKNLIITGGENVSAIEVEDVLRTHPDIADVAVIGTPHAKWGEQVTAIVVARNGASVNRDELIEFAAQSLAGFKKPRRIEVIDKLPRNAANKVQTGLLKEQFSKQE